MEYSGLATIYAPRAAVWDLLTDPAALEACVPGLRALEVVEPDLVYRGMLVLPLGGRESKLPALVRWVKRVERETGRLHVSTLFGSTAIELNTGMRLHDREEEPAGTDVRWEALVDFPDSSENQRRFLLGMLQNLALRAVDEFFVRVKRELE